MLFSSIVVGLTIKVMFLSVVKELETRIFPVPGAYFRSPYKYVAKTTYDWGERTTCAPGDTSLNLALMRGKKILYDVA